MAHKGTEQTIIVDEFIWGGDTSSVELNISVAELDTTDLHSTAMEYIAGLAEWRLTQNGYFDGTGTDGFEKELRARFATSGAQVTYLPIRGTTNTPAYVIPDAFNANLPISAEATGLITMNGEWVSTNAGHHGKLVEYNQRYTGAASGTSIDLGSAGSAGGWAYLHVHEIDDSDSGTSTNTEVILQSSADDVTFAGEATFTFSATGGYAVAMSGTINRYIRVRANGMGGATSIEVTAVAVVDGVTENIA